MSAQPQNLSLEDLKKKAEMKQAVSLVSTTGQPLEFNLVSTKKATMCDHEHLMNLASQISSADSHIKSSATGRLKQIHDQIKKLQEEAVQVLEDAKRDKQLHQAACNLQKKPGQTYYLYEKEVKGVGSQGGAKTEAYFSIMSMEDWNGSCPHKFLGAYRLGYDLTFMAVEKVAETENISNYIESVYDKVMMGGENRIEWKI